MTRQIELSRKGSRHRGKFVATVDDEDFERINRMGGWSVMVMDGRQYAIAPAGSINGKQKQILMHQMVMRDIDHDHDHINGNGLDNTRANLRRCTQSQNGANTGPRKGKKYKGVYLQNKKYIIAQIKCAGKPYFLGVFKDEESAARAYDAKAVELFGEFARLNFP